MKKEKNKFIYWGPRILSILFICFLTMFSLDVFSSEASFFEILIGLLIHNIPVFILSIVLWISWKKEIVGGIFFILAGLFYISNIIFRRPFEINMLLGISQIAGPAFLIGILFLIGWFKRKK